MWTLSLLAYLNVSPMNWLIPSLSYLIYHSHGPLSLNYESKLTFLQFIRMATQVQLLIIYRGISLLSVVGKCQERILHTAIYDQGLVVRKRVNLIQD